MNITNDIKYIGVNDVGIAQDLFEGQYAVPNGMAYNSYVVLDSQIAVMDTVAEGFTKQWLKKLSDVLAGKTPDYLVVQHMEPDHSASITAFVSAYPQAKLVASAQAFRMMKNFYGDDFKEKQIVVTDGSTLSLGAHSLAFVTAPMVHWPEVIVTYDSTDKVLFSADGFGKFGTTDTDEDWACEARRYYFGIVGKYGLQVQGLLKKASALDIKIICPLHGPVLDNNIGYYLNLYNVWSSYQPEEEGVVIAYTSVYGHTKEAALLLAEMLTENGVKVAVNDLARCDMAEAVEDAFRYSKLVLATTTYNGDVFPFMRDFINHLTERNFSNRTVAFIENGSWAPTAARVMKEMLSNCKGVTVAEPAVKILSALNDESRAQLAALSSLLVNGGDNADNAKVQEQKSFVCKICGYVHEGDLPDGFVCPICKRNAEFFEEVK